MMKNEFRHAKLLMLSCVTLVVMFAVVELGLRGRQVWRHGHWSVPAWLRMGAKPAGEWHPFLRSVPRPDTRWIESDAGGAVSVLINAHGFRSREIPLAKGDHVIRVACIGGSVVFDTRVSAPDAWPTVLEKSLQERFPDHEIQVINAGLPGRTSADSVVNLALRVLPLAPDVVILVHGVNDQKPNRYPGFKQDYSHWYSPPPPLLLNGMHTLLDFSLFASHVRFRLVPLFNPYRLENWRGEKLKRYDTVGEQGLEAFRRNLETMIGMCRMHGVLPILGTVGSSLEENGDWNIQMGTVNPLLFYQETQTMAGLLDGFLKYNEVTRLLARQHEIPLVDIDARLPTGKRFFTADRLRGTFGGGFEQSKGICVTRACRLNNGVFRCLGMGR